MSASFGAAQLNFSRFTRQTACGGPATMVWWRDRPGPAFTPFTDDLGTSQDDNSMAAVWQPVTPHRPWMRVGPGSIHLGKKKNILGSG